MGRDSELSDATRPGPGVGEFTVGAERDDAGGRINATFQN